MKQDLKDLSMRRNYSEVFVKYISRTKGISKQLELELQSYSKRGREIELEIARARG